jgi:hypothetical protein
VNARDPTPSQELHSRAALAPVFDDLNKYAAAMHFIGQSTILTLTGARATGKANTLAHHLTSILAPSIANGFVGTILMPFFS